MCCKLCNKIYQNTLPVPVFCKERTKATSFAGVVRQSFRIYDIITEELANGGKILVQNKDETIEILNLGIDIA